VLDYFDINRFNKLKKKKIFFLFIDSCTTLIDLLGMSPVENSGTPTSSSVHTLMLSGTFLGGIKVLARNRMTFAPSSGVTMELSVRSSSEEISRIVIGAVV
jgi:coatomer protein complex subunit gamma